MTEETINIPSPWTVTNQATVYLAGPIDGCTEAEARDWRQDAKKLLVSCQCLDPMDRYFTLAEAHARGREIVGLDKRDISLSDFVLANVWKKGFGTPMEMVFAHVEEEIPVVVVWPTAMGPINPWVYEHCLVVLPTVTDACRWIESVVNRRKP